MKATLSCKPNRFLLNVAMLLVLLPLFAPFGRTLLLIPGTAMPSAAGGLAPLRLSVWLALSVALPPIGMVLVLWRGWVRTSLALLAVALVALAWDRIAMSGATGYEQVDLLIREHSPVTGVDVYCNGVHLGKTPLRVSREEFRKKVKPWTQPPRQDRLELSPSAGGEFTWAKYTWVPQDIFEEFESGLPTTTRYAPDDDDRTLPLLKSSRYWWKFEAYGHAGVTPIANFGGGASGTGRYLEVEANPQTTYPALGPHLEILVEKLRADDYDPDSRWIAHFRRYQSLLFLEFYGRSQEDPRLRPALEAVVRAEFELPEAPTPEDCDRVLAAILDRVEARGAFQVPSLESMAIDLMGEGARQPVVRHFLEEADVRPSSYGMSSSGQWEIRWRAGRAARQLPLEHAAKRLLPDELFDRLVYEFSRTGRYLEIIASYQRKEASRLFHDYLREVEAGGSRPFRRRFAVDRAIRLVSQIHNPQLEARIRSFVADHAAGTSGEFRVREFVISRIGAPGIDQRDLAGWIHAWAPLDEREKLELLARINSPETWNYVRICGATRDRSKREELLYQLSQDPNPSLDPFLIDTYEWYRSPKGPGYWHQSITEALIKADTTAIRVFIRSLWGDQSERRFLLGEIGRTQTDLADLAWMVPLVEQAADPDTQQAAAPLLARMDTPEAKSLLEKWAKEAPDEQVRQAAKTAISQRLQREAEAGKRVQGYADLVSGKIRPDDLLPPQPAWVWDGEKYVVRESDYPREE